MEGSVFPCAARAESHVKLKNIMRCWVPGVLLAVHALAQSPTDAGAGRRIFESQCAVCHGQIGGGGRGPVLNRPKLDKAQMTRRFASSSRRVCATCLEPGNCTPAKWLAWLSMSALLERCRKRRCPAMRRAARIYSANGCAGCHMVAGRRRGFGPELTAIGARRSAAFLRPTILRPGATLPNGFLYVSAAEWHFQFTPNDSHDWDPLAFRILARDRKPRRMALTAPPALLTVRMPLVCLAETSR
jgi:cytochrome c2